MGFSRKYTKLNNKKYKKSKYLKLSNKRIKRNKKTKHIQKGGSGKPQTNTSNEEVFTRPEANTHSETNLDLRDSYHPSYPNNNNNRPAQGEYEGEGEGEYEDEDEAEAEDNPISILVNQLANPDNKDAVELFKTYISNVGNNPTRDIQYDIRVLTSIMSIIHDYTKPVSYTLGTKTINANRDISCCDKKDKDGNIDKTKLEFFMEDFYCDDLNKFIEEYDNFIKKKKSYFFYKSNIANIALLFKCYYKRCFDAYFKKKLRNNIKTSNETSNIALDTIFNKFNEVKQNLINALIKAYKTCKYVDVCELYLLYLDFYKLAVSPSLENIVNVVARTFHQDVISEDGIYLYDIYKLKPTEFNNYLDKATDLMYNDIKTNINFTMKNNDFYIYLSCSHVSEFKQARVYMTRFIDSLINNDYIHEDVIISTLDAIGHDFYFHGNLERIKSTMSRTYTPNNKQFILELYNLGKDVYEYGMYVLQIIQNENSKNVSINFNKHDFYKNFLYYKTNNKLASSQHKEKTVRAFIEWIMPPNIKYTLYDMVEPGVRTGFTISLDRSNN